MNCARQPVASAASARLASPTTKPGKRPKASRLQSELARKILRLLKEEDAQPGHHLVELDLCQALLRWVRPRSGLGLASTTSSALAIAQPQATPQPTLQALTGQALPAQPVIEGVDVEDAVADAATKHFHGWCV